LLPEQEGSKPSSDECSRLVKGWKDMLRGRFEVMTVEEAQMLEAILDAEDS
jgi:hypothetical protein